jgi:hypothetical protein
VEKCGTARQATDDNVTWYMHFACWVNKVTNTHSEYVVLIAFLRQQWLHECASMLHCMCIVCFVYSTSTPH